MRKKEATELRIENGRKAVEDAKITESVELFQSTFFSYVKLKEQINSCRQRIKKQQDNIKN